MWEGCPVDVQQPERLMGKAPLHQRSQVGVWMELLGGGQLQVVLQQDLCGMAAECIASKRSAGTATLTLPELC